MSDGLDREELLKNLHQLGDDNDEVVVAAAKSIHSALEASELSWNDLLVPERDDSDDDEADDDFDVDAEPPQPETSIDNEEAKKLIEKLRQRSGISSELKAELDGYLEDIKEGEFDAADRRYVRALYNRLKS